LLIPVSPSRRQQRTAQRRFGRGHALVGTGGLSGTLSRLRPRKFGFVDHAGVPVTSIRSTLVTSSRSTGPEREVARWIAIGAESVGIVVFPQIAIRGAPQQQDPRARRNRRVADRVIGARGAEEALDR
jgi:hypothetical protein